MAGGTARHALIATNVSGELRDRLRKSTCAVYNSDLRICTSPTGLFAYPDVTVICGEPEFTDERKDTATNPRLLVEVLSDSTRSYDRGHKFHLYRKISSLMEYVTIEQDAVYIEQFVRQSTGQWLLTESKDAAGSVEFSSIQANVPIASLYERVQW